MNIINANRLSIIAYMPLTYIFCARRIVATNEITPYRKCFVILKTGPNTLVRKFLFSKPKNFSFVESTYSAHVIVIDGILQNGKFLSIHLSRISTENITSLIRYLSSKNRSRLSESHVLVVGGVCSLLCVIIFMAMLFRVIFFFSVFLLEFHLDFNMRMFLVYNVVAVFFFVFAFSISLRILLLLHPYMQTYIQNISL